MTVEKGCNVMCKKYIKPPLGVMPRRLFEESRAKDLARAINSYVNQDEIVANYEIITEWTNELLDLLRRFKTLKKSDIKAEEIGFYLDNWNDGMTITNF